MDKLSSTDFKSNIKAVKDAANKSCKDNKVLADLTTAQAILESGLHGCPSNLARNYNNLFGIKGTGTAGSVKLPTHEFYDGKMHTVMQSFASNKTLQDSFDQHKTLFEHGTKDKPDRYKKVLSAQTFEEAAHAVKDAGYCTDPNYPKELMEVYNKWLK